MAYNFQAAIKAGTTPQQITNYLTSQGRQKEAEQYFGSTLKQPSFFQKVGQDVSNAFQSGVQQVKQGINTAANAKNPGQLFKAAGQLGSGVVGAVSSPLAPVLDPVNKVVQGAGNAIGNIPAVQNFANSKAGQITSQGAENVANYANIAGAVGGAMGAPAIEAGVAKTGEVAGNITGNALKGTGSALKGLGEKAYNITVPPTEATAKALVAYDAKQPTLLGRIKGLTGEGEKPVTEANTAARMGLQGTEYGLAVGAKKAATHLWENEIAPKLDQVKGAVNMKTFFDQVEKELQKTPELSRRADVKTALESLRQDYQNVGKNIDLKTLQGYKEGWAKFIPEAAYNGKPIGSALKEVKNIAAGKAREIIYKYVGEKGKQAYIDYGNLQSIIESGTKSITGDLAKKSLSRDIWQTIMDKAITPMATTAGKILYKTGEGLEMIGPKGAKKIGDIVGNPKIGLGIEDVGKKPVVNNYQTPKIHNYQDTLDYKGIKVNNYQTKSSPVYTKGIGGKFTGSTRK